VKKQRLQEIVDLQGKLSWMSNREDVGKTFKILIEGDSKKSDGWRGRNGQNKVVVFPRRTETTPGAIMPGLNYRSYAGNTDWNRHIRAGLVNNG
jgi:tRNA A37 methylthiotransferase MiaB